MRVGNLGGAPSALLCRPKTRTLLGTLAVLSFFVLFLLLPRHRDFSRRLTQPHRPPPPPPPSGPGDNPEEGWTSPIPPKIWQIFLPKGGKDDGFVINPIVLQNTPSWLAMNPGVGYVLAGPEWARRFVDGRFADDAPLRRTYHALRNPGMKSDFLRYLILAREGGVYTDIDTVALQPLARWVPDALRSRVRLVVGVEYDRLDHKPWAEFPYDVQFCQWTIAAAPGHPVFADMARRAVASLDAIAAAHNTTLSQVRPTDFEVINSTGPVAWTRVIFDHIRMADPDVTHLANLSYMKEPRLYGDILLLNIDGFGSGLPHSGATNGSSGLALAKHNFRGSWRDVPWNRLMR